MTDKDLLNIDDASELYKQLGELSIKKLPLEQQPAEIDRRLSLYIDWCLARGRMVTTPGLALSLGIDTDTLRELSKGQNTDGRMLGHNRPERMPYYNEIKAVLKKHLTRAADSLFLLSQDKSQTAAALFGLKSMYDYRETPDKTQVEVTIRYEDLLQEVDAYEQEQASE